MNLEIEVGNDHLADLESFVVENPKLERLESLLAQFNIFEAIGAVRHELRHSDFLAYLLDPNQNHGLGDEFARRVIQRLPTPKDSSVTLRISPIELEIWNLTKLEVRREWQNIDILLLDDSNKLAVIIENKISTTEHSDQLGRYLVSVHQHFPAWRVLSVYLTPEGDAPSHPAYSAVSYATICEISERLVDRRSSTMGADVGTLLRHYIQMLRRHIVTESEIASLCRQIYRKHQKALDLIFEHRPDQQATIRDFLESVISETPDLVLDHCSKSYIRFAHKAFDIPSLLAGTGWTRTGRILLFEFRNRPDGLKLLIHIGPGPEETRAKLFKIATSHPSLFKAQSKSLNEKWNSVYSRPYLVPRDYEEANNEYLQDKILKRWNEFRSNELSTIVSAFTQGGLI